MYSRFMFALRIPALALSAALQFLPIVRVALPATQSAANFLAIIFRWGAGAAAMLGGVHAVSGASTVITTPLNQRATNGVPLGSTQIRLITAPDQAHYWQATGLPPGLYLSGTNGSTSWKILGTPTATGTYNVGLTAKDQANSPAERTTTATMVINVVPGSGGGGNAPPTANPQNVTTAEDSPKAIVLSGSDPDGNPLTYSIITPPSQGTLSGTPPNVTYTPATNYNGPDSFTFRVNDGITNSAAATVSITVTAVNDAPVANAQSVTTAEDTAKAITLSGSDVEGSPLTYAIVTPPAQGTLSGTPPNVTYTPATNYNGPDSFTFRVNDGSLNSAAATISLTITPVNDAPVATSQSVSTPENTPRAIVLTGSDAEGSPLAYTIVVNPTHGSLGGTPPNLTYTPSGGFSGLDSFTFKVNDGNLDSAIATVSISVSSVNSAPVANALSVSMPEDTTLNITLTGADSDGDPLTYSVITQPTNGSLTGTAPNLTYTPIANVNGADSFTFKVNDGTVDSMPATVSISITAVNDAPMADAQNVTTTEDTAKAITLSGSDVEGSPLTYAIVTQPTHGTLSGTPPNVTYVPATNYHGPESFSFRVNDGSLDSAPATVSITITPVNDAPIANAQTVNTSQNTPVLITLTGSDVEGDALTYTVVSQPTHGSVTGAVPNLTYTPAAGYSGLDSLTFQVNDGITNSAVATVAINVSAVNNPPVANAQSVATSENTPRSITLTGGDLEGSPLIYTIVAQPVHGTLGGSPPNVTYTPEANYSGPDSFSFKVNDGNADSPPATVSITITPVNHPPVTINATNATTPGASVTLSPLSDSTDPDGDPLTITSVSPTNGTAVIQEGTNILFTPAPAFVGVAHVGYTISDGRGGNATGLISIVVAPVSTNQFSIAAAAAVLDAQTGLFVQRVNVTNTGAATVAAVRLTVRDLRSGVTLQNASGNNAGQPSVRYDASLNPGQGVTFVLEFYVPDRMPFTSTLEADAVVPSSNNTGAGGAVPVDRSFLDRSDPAHPRFTIEFASVPGRSYTIIYTDDLVNWKAATPSFTASANITQWHDDGPPKTVSEPGSGSRFYRVTTAP